MEPQFQPAVNEQRPASTGVAPRAPQPPPEHGRDFDWVFIGPHGLRAGWSLLLFAGLYYLFREVVGTLFFAAGLIHDTPADSAGAVLIAELVPFLSLVAAALVMILIEDRGILSYNLAGPRRARRFLVGLAAGFAAISLLVGGLALGGWLRLAPAALPATTAIRLGALWPPLFSWSPQLKKACFAATPFRRSLAASISGGLLLHRLPFAFMWPSIPDATALGASTWPLRSDSSLASNFTKRLPHAEVSGRLHG